MRGSRRSSLRPLGGRSLYGQRVDGPAHLVAEHVVDQLVLLDARQALEPVGDHLGAEVVAAAGEVLHADLGAWQRLRYAALKFVCAWHRGLGAGEGTVAIKVRQDAARGISQGTERPADTIRADGDTHGHRSR